MADFENLQADENLIIGTHFSPGRDGQDIQFIVLHHNGGNLSIRDCYNVWQTREASAHYQVQSDGRIGQLVNDWDTAWHAGDWGTNTKSIGIEHADDNSNPWHISDACLENGAHLTAALCKYYGLGRPTWGVNVFGHNHFYATACPASIGSDQNAAYMKRAGEWYDAMVNGSNPGPAPSNPTPPPAPVGDDINSLADRTINGEFGNGEDRRRALGGNYDAVMAEVNRRLLGDVSAGSAGSNDDVAWQVINGQWGNDPDRSAALANAGYDPGAVQQRVNELLGQGGGGASAPQQSSLDDIAQAVIRGDYGNDPERSAALQAAGYDPGAVQQRVNELLS